MASKKQNPAEICAEMAREAAMFAAKHDAAFREDGLDIEHELKIRYTGMADGLREAERRIRAEESK